MLAEGLTDSDHSTLDELLAVFELPDQQNPDILQQQVDSFSEICLKFLFLLHKVSLSPSSIQNPYPSPPPSSNIVPCSPPISAQRPILLPKPIITSPTNHTHYPQQQQITNCVKLQSYAGAASTGPKCVKIEPVINTIPPQPPPGNITIFTTSKPITVSKLPVIKMPLTTTATPITFVKTGLLK
jgi:hypothetical protein